MKTNTIKSTLLLVLAFAAFSCANEPDANSNDAPDSALDSLIELPESRVLDTLTGHWVKKDYLEALQNSSNPFGSQDKLLPISEVVVDETKGTLQLVFGYNEGCSGTLERKGDSLLLRSCDGNSDYNYVFEYDPFTRELLLTADGLSLRFTRISTKVEEAGKAMQQWLVQNKLSGVFKLVEGDAPLGSSLQFGTNGFVRGSSKYNKFKLVLGYGSYPAFNSVIWLYKGANSFDPFYWELQGDSLTFSRFREDMPDLFETAAVYVRQ